MLYYKKFLLGFLFLIFGQKIIGAGLNITTEIPTAIMVFFDNGIVNSNFLLRSSNTLQIDAILAGFSAIQWIGLDGNIYEVRPNIKGLEGWRSIIIKNNTVYIGGNYIDKAIGILQGNIIRKAQ